MTAPIPLKGPIFLVRRHADQEFSTPHARRSQATIVFDMDRSVSDTHGAPEDSAYNRHFGCTCYHSLFVSNQFGALERCALRPGNVLRRWLEQGAGGGAGALMQQNAARFVRSDAGYANPDIYEFLEAEGYKYTIRLPANSVLQESIAWLLKRPVGNPPHGVRRYYARFSYQAGSWPKPAGWLPRSSGIPANCTGESGLS